MKTSRLIATLLSLAATGHMAFAQSFVGGGIDPGDNIVAGGTNTVTVTGVPSLTNQTIEVDVTWTTRHTWAGDVILRLTGPNAATVELLNKPGTPSSAAGDSSNLFGTYTFRDNAVNRIIDIAAPLSGNDDPTGDITPGFYRATNNTGLGNGTPTFSGEVAQTLDTSFGTVGNGDWTLFFSDNAGQDYAPVNGWVLRFVPVPEPTSMVALGAGVLGLAGIARRRFRREPVLA